jgi:hypothetical protein
MNLTKEQIDRRRRIEQARQMFDAKLGGHRVAITEPGLVWLLLCDLVDEVRELREELKRRDEPLKGSEGLA